MNVGCVAVLAGAGSSVSGRKVCDAVVGMGALTPALATNTTSHRFKKASKRETPGKCGTRYYKNVGLGFRTPKDAIEGEAGGCVMCVGEWVLSKAKGSTNGDACASAAAAAAVEDSRKWRQFMVGPSSNQQRRAASDGSLRRGVEGAVPSGEMPVAAFGS